MLARFPAPALVLGGVLSLQLGAGFAAHIFSQVGAGGAGLLRLAFAALLLLLSFRPRLRGRSRAELGTAALLGLVLAGMNLVFYHAIARIPLGVAVTVEFIGPLGVAIAGSRRPLDLVWIVLAVAGILAFAHGGGHINALGLALAAIAGLLWAAYILVQARLGQASEGGSALALSLLVAALVAIPDGVIEGGSQLLAPGNLAIGLVAGLLSSALPYSFELEALRRIATGVFGVLMSLEPAAAALVGLLVLSQGLSAREMIGIVLVCAASLGTSVSGRNLAVEQPG
ncbi:MAG: EamA family transporter [Solirubrobacterales bacterium]|nr:EamA family transporter [Solirubrobacterales bacterium]